MIDVSDEQPQRPPTSGPGSGAAAWRAYAAAVTGSPVESWESMSRDEVMELLESEGATPDAPDTPTTASEHGPEIASLPSGAAVTSSRPRRRPVWMVPTNDGFVPESQLRG